MFKLDWLRIKEERPNQTSFLIVASARERIERERWRAGKSLSESPDGKVNFRKFMDDTLIQILLNHKKGKSSYFVECKRWKRDMTSHLK